MQIIYVRLFLDTWQDIALSPCVMCCGGAEKEGCEK